MSEENNLDSKYLYEALVGDIASLYLSKEDIQGFLSISKENQYRIVFGLVAKNRVDQLKMKVSEGDKIE